MTNATQKTISLILVICTLLILTLFVYRTQQMNSSKVYTSDNATMFPTAREIKSFELMTANQQKFTQKDLIGHWTLLFFGFTHCSNVCPITLDMLGHAYEKLIAIKPDLQVILISLDPTRDTPQKLIEYTQHFHPHFIGVTGKMNELRKLQAQLRIFSEQDQNSSGNNYQILHTSSILLINPKGEWAGLFSYGMKPDQFVYEFEMATNAAA